MSRYRICSALFHFWRNDKKLVNSYPKHIWFEVRATAYESLSATVWQRKIGLHNTFWWRLTKGSKDGVRLRC